jgi:hypothetical protein
VRLQTTTGELASEFIVEESTDHEADFAITLKARGGGLNPDYHDTLELLLQGIKTAAAEIVLVEVVSKPAMRLTPAERRLPLRYPLRLSPQTDIAELRVTLCRLQEPIAQQPTAKGGNGTKRIKLYVKSPELSANEFEELIGPADGALRVQTFLATWNPAVWTWADHDNQVRRTERREPVSERWSTGTRKSDIRPGDKMLLLKQGRSKRGIVGLGVATSEPYPDQHFDADRASAGDKAHYVDVDWHLLVDDNDRIPIEHLEAEYQQVDWSNIVSSGRRLPASVAARLITELRERSNLSEPQTSEAHDADHANAEIAGRGRSGQGFRGSAEQRKAIEDHSMAVAEHHLKTLGWSTITDTSAGNPYDFHCTNNAGDELYVEVKGTTSNGDKLILTRGEVELHRKQFPNNALIVVYQIQLDDEPELAATGGQVRFISPWEIDDEQLEVIDYHYDAPPL